MANYAGMDLALSVWILCIIHGTTATIPSWNMHYVCGQTISQTERGGILFFDSDLLPTGHEMDCRVVIKPAPTESSSSSGNYVLFHFSKFESGKHCQNTNVTVQDGNGINMKPIAGLKDALCGDSTSLIKDTAFRSQSYFVTVIFHRDVTGLNFKSKFNMTFLSFSEGSCGSGNDKLFSCSNNRCIDNKFVCLNLNPCGDDSDCPKDEPTISLDGLVGDIVKFSIPIVFFIVGSCMMYFFVRRFRRHAGFDHNFDDFPSPSRWIRRRSDCCTELCTSCRPCDCCRHISCHCCRNLLGRILNACRRLKRNLTQSQETRRTSRDQGNAVIDSEPVTVSTEVNNADPDSSTVHIRSHGSSQGIQERVSLNSSSERSRTQSFSSLNSDSSDDSEENETGAPPRYRDVARSEHPAPSAPPVSAEVPPPSYEEAAPPSYGEVVANAKKYIKKKKKHSSSGTDKV